jgi:hypothetical protein
MDIEAKHIVSSDSYQKFGVSNDRRGSSESVQDFLDRGLMSKGEAQFSNHMNSH